MVYWFYATQNMTIGLIAYWSCPLTPLGVLSAGGMNVYILNCANYLGLLGHQVDIYTRTHQEQDEKVLETHKNVRLIHLKSPLTVNIINAQKFAESIKRFINRNNLKYDIFHAHYYCSGLVGLSLKSDLKIPLAQTFHTLSMLKEKYAGIIDKDRFAIEKKITQNVDGIIASTELEKKDLIDEYGSLADKISVVQPGVNHKLFKPYNLRSSRLRLKLPRDKKIILFVGRIDPVKGIILLIQAISLLTKKYHFFNDKYRVYLIGGDINSRNFWQHKEVQKITSEIQKDNLTECIRFLGSVPHHMLPYYYSSADIVVLPSVYESFGFVILEAMACKSAVVASRVGGLKYLITDHVNGRLFRNGDVLHLSQVLWQLLNDKNQANKLKTSALNSSQKYCWDKQAKKLADVYRRLLV